MGATQVRGRVWQLAGGSAIALAIAAASVALSPQSAFAADGTWNYNGTNPWSTGGRWNNGIVADGAGFTADFSTVNISADRTINLDSARTIGHLKIGDSATTFYTWTLANNGSAANILTLDVGATKPTITTNPSTTSTISLELAGTNGFSKLGTGTLVLTGANSVTGGITVNSGVLQIGNGTIGSVASQDLTFTGNSSVTFREAADSSQAMGALSFSAGNSTLTTTWGGSGTTTLTFASATRSSGASGNIVFTNGTLGTTNKMVLSGQSAGFLDRGIFVNGSNYAYYDATAGVRGVDWGVDSGSTTAAGGASIGTTTYAQTTGTVTAQDDATFTALNIVNSGSSTQAFTLAAGKTVTTGSILRSGNGTGATTISGGTAIRASDNTDLVIRNDLGNDALVINTAIPQFGTGGITKTGAGTLTLGGSNGYTGGVSVLAGRVIATSASALGTGTATVNSGGTLELKNFTFANAINLSGGDLYGGANTTPTVSGLITVQSASSVSYGSSASMTLGGGLAGSGNLTLNGTTTINGDNTAYTGTLGVRAATLVLGSDTAAGSGSISFGVNDNTSTIRSSSTADRNIANVLTLAGNANTTYSLGSATTGNLYFTSQTTISNSGSTRKLQANNQVTFAAGFTGTGGLTKQGAGTLVLNGASNYSGVTTVSAGTLLVNNTSSGTGAVTVAAGTTLGGNGSIAGAVTNNGTLTPGDSTLAVGSNTGKLTLASLILASTATTQIEIGGKTPATQYDQVSVTGSLSYGGTLSIAGYNGYDLALGGAYDYNLFDAGSQAATSFAAVNIGAFALTPNSGIWTGTQGEATYTFRESDGVLSVVIPEPTATAMLLIGSLGFGLCSRRSRRN